MVYVVAIITIKDRRAFIEYERQALSLLKNYRGQLVSAFTPQEGENKEIHILSFPNHLCFQQFRNDQTIQSLAAMREQAVKATELYVSDNIIEYELCN